MKKIKLSKKGEGLINYGIYSIVIIALGGIGFFFGMWEFAAVLAISSVCVFPILYLNLYSFAKPKTEGAPIKTSSIALLGIGRVLIMGVSIVSCAFLLKYTDGIGGKYRLLIVLLTLVPLLLAQIIFMKTSKDEGNSGSIVTDEAMQEIDEIEKEVQEDSEADSLAKEIEAEEKALEEKRKKLEEIQKDK